MKFTQRSGISYTIDTDRTNEHFIERFQSDIFILSKERFRVHSIIDGDMRNE